MIKITNLKKVYQGRTVLDIGRLTVENGETVILLGHNGSGKSTLLKILADIIEATWGNIIKDENVLYLPQQSLPFNKTVKKNILYSLSGTKKEKEEAYEKVCALLKLKELENKNARTLSSGECQRLAIARLLCKKCDLLLLDEPTSAADTESRRLIVEAVKAYQKETGCILIVTTHIKEDAELFGGRKIVLTNGKLPLLREEDENNA